MPINKNIRKNSDLKFIMIHHSEHYNKIRGKDINISFVQEGQFGIPFDIIINVDGKIDLGPRWIRAENPLHYEENVPLYSVFNYTLHDISDACPQQQMNYQAIHILLIGNFDEDLPSIIQINVLEKLINLIRKNIPTIKNILYHSDIVSISCPGIRLNDVIRKDKLRKILLPDTKDTHEFKIQGSIIPILSLIDNTFPDVNIGWNDVATQANVSVNYYNIYRIDVTSNGTITKIGTSTGLTFDDFNVIVGNTYTYYVSAVLSNGIESQLSNAVTTTVSGLIPLKYLYVFTNTGKIVVFDVSTPTSPIYLGIAYNAGGISAGLEPVRMIQSDTYIYTIYNRNLRIFYWSNPTSLLLVGTFFGDTVTYDLKGQFIRVSQNRLIANLGSTSSGIVEFDVTDPTIPTPGATSTVGGPGKFSGCIDSNGIWWGGCFRFASNGLYKAPVIPTMGAGSFMINNIDLAENPSIIVGNYLYIGLQPGPSTINIYNISSGTPSFVGSLNVGSGVGINYIGLNNNYLFVLINDATTKIHVKIYDISNPASPVFVGQTPAVSGRDGAGNLSQIVVKNNYLYTIARVTSVNAIRLLVFDISNKASPNLIADVDIPTGDNPISGLTMTGYPNELQNQGGNISLI